MGQVRGVLSERQVVLITSFSVTRKWRDYAGWIGDVALVLIDEVHLLNEVRNTNITHCSHSIKVLSHLHTNRIAAPHWKPLCHGVCLSLRSIPH